MVVALDDRKPPEFPYPASLDDIATVLKWIRDNAASFEGDKNNMVWVGDSGGGLNLSFFPPTLVVTSERDALKSQGIAFYTKLTAAGVAARMVDVPQMGHLGVYWAEGHSDADMAPAETIKFILAESPN